MWPRMEGCGLRRAFLGIVLLLVHFQRTTPAPPPPPPVWQSLTGFTCQGTSYNQALRNCPDKGAQQLSSGGNVSMFVKAAYNLPGRTSGLMAGSSDPFVKFVVGSNFFTTSVVRNTLNPVWNEEVNIGLLSSATNIIVEIWNYNVGVVGSEMLVRSSIRVPYCSMFHANITSVDCGAPFGCRSEDSSFQMPTRLLCNESGIVSFKSGEMCFTSSGICLFLDVMVRPFEMNIELVNEPLSISVPPTVSVFGPRAAGATWTYTNQYGYPFIGDTSTTLDFRMTESQPMAGALMVQLSNKDKSKGQANRISFYASVNFPATIYVCRQDADNANGIPDWLTRGYNGGNLTVNKLNVPPTKPFGCFNKDVPGTVKNRWGGLKENALAFYTNTIPGHDVSMAKDATFYASMYIILAVPRVIVPPFDNFQVIYDQAAFVASIGSYGLVWAWFIFIIARFLDKVSFRLDRVESFVASRVLTGENKSILGTLFLNYGNTPCNVEFRSHLFHARNAIYIILSAPFFMLIGWGFSIIYYVRPTALGFGVGLMGIAGVLQWFGLSLWERDNWRLSGITILSLVASVLLFFIYILSCIFIDAAVVVAGRGLNVAALSLIFGTINTFPLMLMFFQTDKTQRNNLQAVLEKMTDAVVRMRKTERRGEYAKSLPANKLLHSLLGSQYTINPNVAFFKFGTVLQEPSKQNDATGPTDPQERDALYDASLLVLFLYLIIALARTDYPSLAFLNCLAVLTFDVIHTSLANGDNKWSPGYKIALLIFGRISIMGSTPSLWLVNYSAAYLIYAVALMQEIINKALPMLSKREAGEVAFAGKDDSGVSKSNDIAGTAFFCFGWLTFAFTCLLLVSGFGNISGSLPVPKVNMAGAKWPIYSFGLIAILLVITGGLLISTIRANYLAKHGLLRGWARDAYMMRSYVNTPVILGIFSELAIIFSGVLIYAITKSAAVLVVCIFVPLIVLSLGHAYREWVKNDYELVVWPPKDAADSPEQHDNPSDLEVAFHMIENLFGEEAAPETVGDESSALVVAPPVEKKLKGFKLPALETAPVKVDAPIKMPPLPLKSVLRRKRQNLGINVKAPGVTDLKAREGPDDASKQESAVALFADTKDDLWAQFGDGQDADEKAKEDKRKAREKKRAETLKAKPRGGFLNHPRVVMFIDAVQKNPIFIRVWTFLKPYYEFLEARIRKHSKVDVGDGEEEKDGDDDDGGHKKAAPKSENLSQMNFWHAVIGGYLSSSEYATLMSWFGGMFAIMMMGVTLAGTVAPPYLGHVIWVSVWMFILTCVMAVKYLNTFVIDGTMKGIFAFMCLFHLLFTFSFFGAYFKGDATLDNAIWILDFFFYFPAFLYMAVEFLQWREDNYVIVALDKDGDGDVSLLEYLEYFRGQPIVFAMMIVLNWQFYLWINVLLGQVGTLLLLVGGVGYVFIRDWAIHDFFLSPEYTMYLSYMTQIVLCITLLVAVLSTQNPLFSLSVFFVTFLARALAGLVMRYLIADPDTIVYFSPTFMPAYSYDPKTNDVVDESRLAKEVLSVLVMGALWGACMVAFLYPVNIGIQVACSFLLVIAAVIASAVSYVPTMLGKYQSMLGPEGIIEAARIARERFVDRRIPLKIEFKEYEGENTGTWTNNTGPKSLLDKLKEKQAIQIASETMSEARAMTMVQDDGEYVASQIVKIVTDDEDDPWYVEYWHQFTSAIGKLVEQMPMGQSKGWRKHSEALFDLTDAMAEAIICGKGPMGWLGVDGYLFKLFKMAQEYPRLKFLQQPWLNAYDEFGNNKNYVPLGEPCELTAILARFKDVDAALNFTYYEETRCAVHFLLLLVVGASAKMQREQVLFQKFLRENRFRLASNGISPPAEIFTSTSFASIDIPLVAVWLSTLSVEERERFHMLKATFSDEQRERDLQVDAADKQLEEEGTFHRRELVEKDTPMVEHIARQMSAKQDERINNFSESLHPMERTTFVIRRDEWTTNSDCYVHFKEQALYDKFRAACMQDKEESVEFGRMVLKELEAGLRNCRLGEYGRAYQFVDDDFPPGDSSVGEGAVASQVLGFRCAPGIVDEVKLFRHGSDPHDVEMGIFDNAWLLAAISMLAVAGGGGNASGKPVSQVANLFVGHIGPDGEMTYNTEVGAYCVRLFRQGVWNSVVVDDLFPMLHRENWTNENRGLASAHAHECSSIWVALVEKAMAKFLGSYDQLSKGFVHHALTDLTGSESECLPLAAASRGAGRRALWDQLVKFKKNGYILGAGTGSSALVDREILDMGIVFNAAYPVYNVWYVDGHQIVKLHKPPGSNAADSWRGDWSHESPLWTRRLKHKLGVDEDDHSAFYMSFDDFCNVFRYLYVCKYYDKAKWHYQTIPGFWKKATVLAENKDKQAATKKDQKKKAAPKAGAGADAELDAEKREEALAKIDTAGGLPSVDNPGCILENNPFYSLKIHRPTDVRLSVSQTDSRGKASGETVPFSVYILKCPLDAPQRLSSMTREDIVSQLPDVSAARERSLYASLKPGMYMVLVGSYVSGLEGKFSISISSNYRTAFTPVWPPKWVVQSGEQSPEDVMKLLAQRGALEIGKGIKEAIKKAKVVWRDLIGTGRAEEVEEEEEDDDED